MTVLSQTEYQAALRADFYSFMLRCFAELNPGAAFLPSWHIELMAAKLQAVRDRRIRRLIINIPPRHLKSLAASIALPAWLLGHHPAEAIVNVTYGQELSDKFARDCRAVMTASWYRALFPTRLTSPRAPLQELVTTQGGFRLATSVGGVLTGRGADLIIIDDPLKPSDAMSETRRVAANEWFDGTLYSRLNDKVRGAIVIIMQRLHEDDLVGHVLRREGWEVVSFPAIAEVDEQHLVETPFGRKTFGRLTGAALHPERESLETLKRIRATMGEYNFAGQYQQTPAPAGGGMVKEAWFRRYRPEERPASFDQIVQSWDTANKPSELADYSVCTTWAVKGPHFYLLNVLRKKLDFPNLKRAVREQADLFSPTTILIEDKASGTQLIQDLIDAGLSRVTRYKPDGDKIMRLHAQTATIENGFVHLPDTAHWLADYLHELTRLCQTNFGPPSGVIVWGMTNPFRYFNSSPEVIRLVVMMYVRYPLSLRNVEDLLAERGIDISYETVRFWWNRFGPMFAAEIRKKRVAHMRGYTQWRWHVDEVFVKVNGALRYLWRAVDHEGEVLEAVVTAKRDKAAALKLLKRIMKRYGPPQSVVTDGLRAYSAAMDEIGAADRHEVGRHLNNRAENSHQPFRRRERAMQRFRSMKTLQKFSSVHAQLHNHFNQERNLVTREIYKQQRSAALAEWRALAA